MNLEALGWHSEWEARFAAFRPFGWEPARVAVEDRQSYILLSTHGECRAQVTGKYRLGCRGSADFPKVGDWAALQFFPGEGKGLIHAVLPRQTKLSRKEAGRSWDEQILAVNVDIAFLVQALDTSFNIRLLERQLIMAHESGAQPVVVLNKADLAEEITQKIEGAKSAATGAPVMVVSAKTRHNFSELTKFIRPGTTVVFIGPSGVGKSTLINCLSGEDRQPTTEVRESDSKGRHTTSCRELILLPGGGVVIDTPGIREFHLWLAGPGVADTFPEITAWAARCRFRDCTHLHEADCAVRAAVSNGEFPEERYQHFLKLHRELSFLEQAQEQRTILERKRRAKIAQKAFNRMKRRSGFGAEA